MYLYKIYFIVNIVLLFIETITIYLYSDDMLWLVIMLSTLVVQIMTIISTNQNEKKKAK